MRSACCYRSMPFPVLRNEKTRILTDTEFFFSNKKSPSNNELFKNLWCSTITSSHHTINLYQLCCTVKFATLQFFHLNKLSLYQFQHVLLLYCIYVHLQLLNKTSHSHNKVLKTKLFLVKIPYYHYAS